MPPTPQLPQAFEERFAAWLRIEPRCRSDDFGRGIQARVGDPLWLLARQWQTGEFQGEDVGSPIRAELDYSTRSIDRIRLGDDGPPQSYTGDVPLEVLVEREPPPFSMRERVRIGQAFERRLLAKLTEVGAAAAMEALIAQLRGAAPFPLEGVDDAAMTRLDRATQRFVRFMRGRVIDGRAVADGPIARPAGSPLTQADLDGVRDETLVWHARVCNRPTELQPPAWSPARLHYGFDLHGPEPQSPAVPRTRLVAPDYRSGDLDWYSFSAAGGVQASSEPPTAASLDPIVTTPTRIAVAATSARWWAFEDGDTDFGALDVAKPDLAKLLLMEFVLIYGDDWFSIPAPVRMGNLARVDSLKVWTTFGEDVVVGSARRIAGDPTERFDLFTLSPLDAPRASGVGNFIFIPPVLDFRQESPPIDEVRFLRDEGANMVWGVEHLVPNGLGRPVSGFDAQRERIERERDRELDGLRTELQAAEEALEGDLTDGERAALERTARELRAEIERLLPHARPTPSQGEAPRYRLATTVPENWIPFTPVRRGATFGLAYPRIQFRRAQMLRNTASDDPEPIPSLSRLLDLNEAPLLFLNEEAIPRAGLRVQLTKQRARWTDGSTHVWLGRKVLTGRGEGASGLRFDVVADGT